MIDHVLVVDDELLTRQFLAEVMRRQGLEVCEAASGEQAIELLGSADVQLAFVDLKMGAKSGMDVLRHVRQHCPEVMVVIVTAYGTVDEAVTAMQLGAFDFIIKPVSPDQAEVLLAKARQWVQLHAQQAYMQAELDGGHDHQRGVQRIVGDSPAVREIKRLIERVASTQATVLVHGESGTGKELVAAEIHRLSDPEGKRPYIRMNCAAVPENLLESELFGHEKGAFTGASERRVGRFELADGGTILLDEISEISVGMQAKLLRVLQESEFERVGGSKTINVDVRVIATTNRHLLEQVEEGNFREDLYYRINVFPIQVPPLRERGDDIVNLARFMLKRESRKLRRDLTFSAQAEERLCHYPWPGNIRELEHVVERLAILHDGPILQVEHLPPELSRPLSRLPSATAGASFNLEDLERQTIERALAHTQGNRTAAADLLGFSVRTLRNKLNQYASEGELIHA